MPCDGLQRIGRLEADRQRPGRAATSHRAILWWAMVALIATPAAAGENPPATEVAVHRIPRLEAEIHLDGKLEELAWGDAWTYELAYEVEPGENTPAPARTEVLVFHDRTRLYVGFRAFDPEPSRIRAHLSDRDAAWADDWVGVVLDTFNDERRNYLLAVNPRTVVFVGYSEDSRGDATYDLTTAIRSVFVKLGYAWVP